MPLRLYGVIDTLTQVEFMVRADSDHDAEQAFALLNKELDTESESALDEFSEPILIEPTLTSKSFSETGTVNGRHLTTPYAVAHLYRDISTISTPNSAANDITGSLTVIAWINWDIAQDSNYRTIISKQSTAPDLGWDLGIQDRKLVLHYSTTGNDLIDLETVEDVVGIDTGVWVRVTFDSGTGNVTFYESVQSQFTPQVDLTWKQFSLVGGGFSVLNSPDVPVTVGSFPSDTTAGEGDYYRVMGIASADPQGPLAWDMFPDRDYVGGNTWNASLSVAKEEWTLSFVVVETRI